MRIDSTPGRGQGGDQRLSLSANRRRTLCAECRDQGICAGSRSVRDRLPDPRRVHREIHRVRDARRRLTGLVRQSRHLAGRCRVMGAVKFSPLPHCSRQVARRAPVKVLGFETLWSGCCGIDPGSAVFSQCGADLHLVECADRVRRLTAQKVLLTAQKVAVQSKVDVG